MTDVMVYLLSMGLTVVMMPRDHKLPNEVKREQRAFWTPTYKGSRVDRYMQAVNHYQERMGLERDPIFEVSTKQRLIGGEPRCAWTYRAAGWEADVLGFADVESCEVWKPELLALHEQCHRRLAHIEGQGGDASEQHDEVRECMGWYSAKERR